MIATIAVVFFLAIALAGVLGWTVDSRDGAGWAPARERDRNDLWDRGTRHRQLSDW